MLMILTEQERDISPKIKLFSKLVLISFEFKRIYTRISVSSMRQK